MPELPEVETIRRQLEVAIVGKKIVATEVLSAKRLNVSAEVLKKETAGARIIAVRRRAKLLIIDLAKGNSLAIHLKMTGRVLLTKKNAPPAKHTFVIFKLSNGAQIMWEDYRRFGFMKFFSKNGLDEYLVLQKFGPEPLDDDFDAAVLTARLEKRPRVKIKQLLMDPSCIAGVGNIYAAEALYFARIAPARAAGTLSKKEISELVKGIKNVLTESIKNRGTSADAYVDARGVAGTNVKNLKVYGRGGEPCLRRDGGTVKKTKLAGRGTFWCPVCQK